MRRVLIAVGLLFAAGNFEIATPVDAARPNVLVILADDLGFSDLGCYGGEIETPNLDALAAGGLRYTQFYNTARCWPTRAALLTGYYPQQVGFDALPDVPGSNRRERPRWARLLPEYLRPLGYRSYHSGKWHVDGGQLAGGFDRSYMLDDYDRFFSPKSHKLDDKSLPAIGRERGYYSTTAIADYTIEFLQEHASEHSDAPFFAYVAFLAPHFPLHALSEDIARYRDTYREGWDTIRQSRWRRVGELFGLPGELSPLEPKVGTPSGSAYARTHKILGPGELYHSLDWVALNSVQQEYQATKMSIHAAMVHRMDLEIGRIIEQLRAMNALDNTLILFLSDNGASAEIMVRGDGHDPQAAPGSASTFFCLGPGWSSAANTPFRRHKMWVYEGGIATPLIAHWPKGITDRGKLRSAVGHVIDIAPTILQLAGGDWPTSYEEYELPQSPGRDLVPTFESDVSIERDYLWWLHQGHRAIRVGEWKLVAARGEPWQLYDLGRDRAENVDLAGKHPERVRELEGLWHATTHSFAETAR